MHDCSVNEPKLLRFENSTPFQRHSMLLLSLRLNLLETPALSLLNFFISMLHGRQSDCSASTAKFNVVFGARGVYPNHTDIVSNENEAIDT
jgi:hypothetical protein